MNMQLLTWLNVFHVLLGIAFHVAILIFLVIKPMDKSPAKTYAILGFAIAALLMFLNWGVYSGLSRLVAPDSFMLYHTLWGLVSRVIGMVSTGLIVAAVVVGRSPKHELTEEQLIRSRQGNPVNPYTATTSE